MGCTKTKDKLGYKGKRKTVQKPGKQRKDTADPVVKKNGFALRQSVWNSIRVSVQKFGVTKQPKHFELFMELPEMHAQIRDIALHDAVLDFKDSYTQERFDSEAGMRWELPNDYNLQLNRDGQHCKLCKLTKNICGTEWNHQHHQGYVTDPNKQPMYHQFTML